MLAVIFCQLLHQSLTGARAAALEVLDFQRLRNTCYMTFRNACYDC